MTGHSSGKWRVVIVKGSYKRPALVMTGDKVVASCLGDQLSPDATSIGEATANARLISAAPEMLAALIAARDYLSCIPESAAGDDDDAMRLCRDAGAAIAKATGSES